MKKCLCAVLALFMALSLAGCGGNNDKTNGAKPEKPNSSSSVPEKDMYKRYALGEAGVSGEYQLKTVSFETTTEIPKLRDEKYTTNNEFVVVEIEIAAIDQALDTGYSLLDFLLVDTDKKTYAADDKSIELNVILGDDGYVGPYDALNPGLFKKAKLVFEVPKGIKPALIANSNGGSDTYVEYSLT